MNYLVNDNVAVQRLHVKVYFNLSCKTGTRTHLP